MERLKWFLSALVWVEGVGSAQRPSRPSYPLPPAPGGRTAVLSPGSVLTPQPRRYSVSTHAQKSWR